jgi:hypothetical protein
VGVYVCYIFTCLLFISPISLRVMHYFPLCLSVSALFYCSKYLIFLLRYTVYRYNNFPFLHVNLLKLIICYTDTTCGTGIAYPPGAR